MPPGTQLGTREAPTPARPRSWVGRAVRRTALALCLVVALAAGGLWLAEYSLYRQLGRVDADLTTLPDRPREPPGEDDAVDIAVLGVSRGRWVSQMVLHIVADRRGATFVSVPDSRARVLPAWRRSMPADPTGADVTAVAGRVEQATGRRLEHVAILDWRAVAQLIDRLDGVNAYFGPEGADARWPEYLHVSGGLVDDLVAGDGCLAGPAAARAERQRVRRQQVLLYNVLDQTLHQELVRSPGALYRDLDVLAENLTVDSGWSQRELVGLVVSLRHLRSHAIAFETAPGLDQPRAAVRAAGC